MTTATKTPEHKLLGAIAERALNLFHDSGNPREYIDVLMDIVKTHEAHPLRLQEMLDADDGNFGHDIGGIYRHMNRTTGKLEGGFLPRYVK